jgi:hypothetical protein
MPSAVSIRTVQEPDILFFVFLEARYRHVTPCSGIVEMRTALKKLYFTSSDFELDLYFIPDVSLNLALAIRFEKLLDSHPLKFG